MTTLTVETVSTELYEHLKIVADNRQYSLQEAVVHILEKHRREAASMFNYGKLVDDAPIGIFRTAPDGHITYANLELAKILGYKSQKELTDPAKDIVKDFLEPEARKEWKQFLQDEGAVVKGFECRVKTSDNGHINSSLIAKRVQSSDGVFFDWFLLDVTVQKRAEAELRATKEELESILRNIHGFFYTCEESYPYKIITVSPGCYDITGHTQDALKKHEVKYGELIRSDYKEYVKREIQEAVKHRRIYSMVYPIITKAGGTKWVYERGQGRGSLEKIDYLEGFITDFDKQKKYDDDAHALAEKRAVDNQELKQNMKLRWLLTYTFMGQFVIANMVILILTICKSTKEGIGESTLIAFFAATVAELAGVVILIAKYLFPLSGSTRDASSKTRMGARIDRSALKAEAPSLVRESTTIGGESEPETLLRSGPKTKQRDARK